MSVPRGTPPAAAVNPLWDAATGGRGGAGGAAGDAEARADGAPLPSGARCAGCAWRYAGGRGKPVERCRRHRDARVDPAWPACPAFTAAAELDCLTCGACCREAYHRVEVGRRDPFVRMHPGRVSTEEGRLVVTRAGPRCACLAGEPGAYHCVVYADRPRTCRDFPRGGASCVDARRRVGLTR